MKKGIILISCFDKNAVEYKKMYSVLKNIITTTKMSCKIIYINDIIREGNSKFGYKDIFKILLNKVKDFEEGLIAFDNTELGKCLAAEMTIKKSAGFVAECFSLDYSKKNGFIGSRIVYGDSMVADITQQNSDILIVTLNCISSNDTRCGYNKSEFLKSHFYIRNIEEVERKKDYLKTSKIVFGVGRGVDIDTYQKLELIAKRFGAEIGGSRVAVENGIVPREKQIGQSGICITPNIYIAFGISGAGQHLVGIKDAKEIISINRDKDAPINRYADIVVINNVENIVNQLMGGGCI